MRDNLGSSAVHVTAVATLDEVPVEEWDALIDDPGGFYSSWGWLRSLESEPDRHCEYLLARLGPDLVGALPLYTTAAMANEHYRILDRWPDLAAPGAPQVLAGSSAGYRTSLLVAPELTGIESTAVLRALVKAARDRAHHAADAGLGMLFVEPRSVRRLAAAGLCPHRPALSLAADAVIPVGSGSFDDFLAGLRRSQRRHYLRETRHFEPSLELAVATGPESASAREVGDFVRMTQARHGAAGGADYFAQAFAEQKRYLGERLVTFRVLAGVDTVGLVIAFAWRGSLNVRMGGFDYSRIPENSCAYFNATVHGPARYCCEYGLGEVRLGPGSPWAKISRGARLEPLADIAWHADGEQEKSNVVASTRYWQKERLNMAAGFDTPAWRHHLDSEEVES